MGERKRERERKKKKKKSFSAQLFAQNFGLSSFFCLNPIFPSKVTTRASSEALSFSRLLAKIIGS